MDKQSVRFEAQQGSHHSISAAIRPNIDASDFGVAGSPVGVASGVDGQIETSLSEIYVAFEAK